MTENYPPIPPEDPLEEESLAHQDSLTHEPVARPYSEPLTPLPGESLSGEPLAPLPGESLPGGPFPGQETAGPELGQEPQGTADVARSQASDLGQTGVEAGRHTADVAREQAAGVAAEAGRQGRDLVYEARDRLTEQAGQGQQRMASQLLSLSDELHKMAENSDQGGMAAGLARQAASRTRDAGQWLDGRGPEEVLDEVQSFARRRPAVFIACAVGVGLLAGRLTRGIKDAGSDGSAGASPGAGGTL
jgi:hypothetical protein